MLTVSSTTYPSGWGKRAGKHRTWTAEYAHQERVYAAQALALAREREVEECNGLLEVLGVKL